LKISPSIYSNKVKPLPELVKELDEYRVDTFHVDCNDDIAVFEDISEIRKISQTPIDLHIISKNPEKYFPLIESLQIEQVQIQFEALTTSPILPKNSKTKWGLAITNNTEIEVFERFRNDFSFILLMTTTPGQSGGVFNTDTFQRIRQFRKRFPSHKIHVDGGVNGEVSFILRNMGVDSVVSGSFLVNHKNIGVALLDLMHREVESVYKVKDFMIKGEDLPVIYEDECSFKNILNKIEFFKQGFVCVINRENEFIGLSSNADIRRGLIKNDANLSIGKVEDFINYHPVKIHENFTISEMIQFIKNKNFIISFLPVVDAQNQLTGVITFNQLIRGE